MFSKVIYSLPQKNKNIKYKIHNADKKNIILFFRLIKENIIMSNNSFSFSVFPGKIYELS
jgi:hypothetical protein